LRLLLDAKADVNAASHTGLTAVSFASTGGHSEALSLLLAAHQLATETMAYAGGVAAANGHADIAAVVVKGLWVRDGYAAAAPCLAQQPVADAVLGQWLAAEDAVKVLEQQQEAQWPAQQQVMIQIARMHQELQAETADIDTSVSAAAVQGEHQWEGGAAGDPVVLAAVGSAAAVDAATLPQRIAQHTQPECQLSLWEAEQQQTNHQVRALP
jgi:hypothetical protein